MYNFLNSKLLPKINSKSPCTENYEVDNLISNVFSTKARGFIAYPSIKPPVELEFKFICGVNIFYIAVKTTVGNLRCSGIELFAKNSNSAYVSIAKAIYNNEGVIFCNSRRYTKTNPPPTYNSSYYMCFFRSNTFRSFLNANSIKIVIFKTERSAPCLGSIEVWGQPSKSCSPKTVETIHKLMGVKSKSQDVKEEDNINAKKNDFIIPEDFKDDLTYELMTIPYTLPSGKTIDQSTLEKQNEIEKSFGRKPSDPFTGIKFNEQLKPVLNVPLKSRIDMFLLQNSHRKETFGLKRTLRSDNYQNKKLKENKITESSVQHQPSSSDNLDILIEKVKDNKNFISFTRDEGKLDRKCTFCNIDVDYFYKLPCKHCYCRKCLLELCKNCICSKCNLPFIKADVEKCQA